MSDIVIHSEPGQFPAIDLQPGNTIAVTLAGTDAYVVINNPLAGLPWCEVISEVDHTQEHFDFIPNRMRLRMIKQREQHRMVEHRIAQRRKQVAEEEAG